MKISTKIENGEHSAYEKTQLGNPPRVFTTNAWKMHLDDDNYIDMDLTDPEKPVFDISMKVEGEDLSWARAFPCASISMFGRYETVGAVGPVNGKWIPKLQGRRGQAGMECPKFDLEWCRALTGYPCKTTEMPKTIVHAACDIPKHMNCNTLIDLYLHFMLGAKSMNDHISPNDSKLLNIQFQIGHGAVNRDGAHAFGWSGGVPVLTAIIDGVKVVFAYKLEDANGNRFPFISADIPADSIDINKYVHWVFHNWGLIEEGCRNNDCDLMGCTIERMLESYTCGPHVGNEVLGYAVGQIRYSKLKIEVEQKNIIRIMGPGDQPQEPPAKEPPVNDMPNHDSSEPEKEPTKKKPKPGKGGDDDDGGGFNYSVSKLDLRVGGEGRIASSRGGTLDDDCNGLVSCTDTWPDITLVGLRKGSGNIYWKNSDGVLQPPVKVKVKKWK